MTGEEDHYQQQAQQPEQQPSPPDQQPPPPPTEPQVYHQPPATGGYPQGPEPISKKPNSSNIWIMVISIIIAVILILVYLFLPATSPLESVHDADGDGYSDSVDAFPNDRDEWKDTDGDGVGDNGDAFPTDPTESDDSDGDGVGNNDDAFPSDSTEWDDSDGDGYGDNCDVFPTDPTEWYDDDNDGYGNNEDDFPNDPGEWDDSDGDGYGDNDDDEFPNDSTEWKDTDSDGVGDNDDFYDSGNGKIKISITKYDGDGTADAWTNGDPYFMIYVDANLDGVYESKYTTPVHMDDEYFINDPLDTFTVDIGDDVDSIKFYIRVYDLDGDGDDNIDYNDSPLSYWYIHTVNDPYSRSWSYNGAVDLEPSEIDCLLEYKIEVVG